MHFLIRIGLVSAVIFCMAAGGLAPASSAEQGTPNTTGARVPILVELFTSEGCSSCPPADAFLQKLDRQPLAGAEIVVLSEHVDYWNHIGWKDPYSARQYSDRQRTYANRFDLGSPYTPQMVVDGDKEFVGSDPELAKKAFDWALTAQKITVRLSAISIDAGNTLHARIETGSVPSDAEVMVAIALSHAESQVLGGENGGRTLTHTAVVRTMVKAGMVRRGQSFAQDAQIRLEPGLTRDNLRLVAFVQQLHQGKVLGAAVRPVPAN